MAELKKKSEKSGGQHIRSPSSKAKPRKYTESEKLTVCILYEFLKSSDKAAKICNMESSSVRYILKNNSGLRERAKSVVTEAAESEAAEFAERLKNTAMEAIERLLGAVTDDAAIGKSNSQQLAVAMATLMDKFSLMPTAASEENGGVIVLTAVENANEKGENENGRESEEHGKD